MKLTDDEGTKLKYFKDCVDDWEQYWQENNARYINTIYFVGVSTLPKQADTKLDQMNRPPMQFNGLEPYGAKLMGEFADNEPSIEVQAAEGIMADAQLVATEECLEAHFRHDFQHCNNDNAGYKVMKDLYYGGFGCFEVLEEYAGTKKWDYNIPHRRVNPTYVGWDPAAMESHKGDGKYCYKKTYMTEETVASKFSADVAKNISYESGDSNYFSWSYSSGHQKIALIIDFYWKYERKGTLLKLPKEIISRPEMREIGFTESMDKRDYKKACKRWDELGIIAIPPQPVNSRPETFTEIIHFVICENKILLTEGTDYEMLPYVFVDGNSVETHDERGGTIRQITRPLFYHALDAQRLKDFAGQSLASDLEMTSQSYIMAPEEAIDEKNLDKWLKPYQAAILTYKSMYNGDPNHRIEPPHTFQKPPISEAIPTTFFASDKLIETSLGFFDTRVANSQDASGAAIQEAQLQSDAAASPFRTGYFEGLDRVAQIKLNLYPKFYKTPRSIPVMLPNGKRGYAIINQQLPEDISTRQKDPELLQNQAVFMDYDPDSLLVSVKPGASTSLQKRKALDQLNQMAQYNPTMQAFLMGPGLENYLSNVEIDGIDRLKAEIGPFQQQQQQQQAIQAQVSEQMQQLEQQMLQFKGMLIQAQAQKASSDAQTSIAKVQLENKKVDNKEAMETAQLILDKQASDQQFQLDVAGMSLDHQSAQAKMYLDNKAMDQKTIDQLLEVQRTMAQNEQFGHKHNLEVDKHFHAVKMAENAKDKQEEVDI